MSEAKEGSSRRDFLKIAGGFAAGVAAVGATVVATQPAKISSVTQTLTETSTNMVTATEMPTNVGYSREQDAFTIGVQTYIWGFPPWMDSQINDDATSVEEPTEERSPWNVLSHSTKLRGPEYRVVQSPNNNTLYSGAAVDLTEEPMIFHVPDFKGRYYTFQLVDKYTNNFAYISQRTKGFREQVYAFCGPGWSGKLPIRVERIDVPTFEMTIAGRIGVDSEADIPQILALQRQIRLSPLSRYGEDYRPGRVPIRPRKEYSGSLAFFQELGDIVSKNRPPECERGLTGLFERIGLSPDYGFDPAKLDEQTRTGLERAIPVARAIIETRADALTTPVNGWSMLPYLKEYFGTNYLDRAAIAWRYIYPLSPEEAAYATALIDGEGQTLDGSRHRYTITFPKGATPPVDAFWSITMYAMDGFLVENQIKRYSIGSHTACLEYDANGSLEITIQHESPGGDEESNWLPAPRSQFYLILRMYLPKLNVINAQYPIPPIKRVD